MKGSFQFSSCSERLFDGITTAKRLWGVFISTSVEKLSLNHSIDSLSLAFCHTLQISQKHNCISIYLHLWSGIVLCSIKKSGYTSKRRQLFRNIFVSHFNRERKKERMVFLRCEFFLFREDLFQKGQGVQENQKGSPERYLPLKQWLIVYWVYPFSFIAYMQKRSYNIFFHALYPQVLTANQCDRAQVWNRNQRT